LVSLNLLGSNEAIRAYPITEPFGCKHP